jgi:hypothetical protein
MESKATFATVVRSNIENQLETIPPPPPTFGQVVDFTERIRTSVTDTVSLIGKELQPSQVETVFDLIKLSYSILVDEQKQSLTCKQLLDSVRKQVGLLAVSNVTRLFGLQGYEFHALLTRFPRLFQVGKTPADPVVARIDIPAPGPSKPAPVETVLSKPKSVEEHIHAAVIAAHVAAPHVDKLVVGLCKIYTLLQETPMNSAAIKKAVDVTEMVRVFGLSRKPVFKFLKRFPSMFVNHHGKWHIVKIV